MQRHPTCAHQALPVSRKWTWRRNGETYLMKAGCVFQTSWTLELLRAWPLPRIARTFHWHDVELNQVLMSVPLSWRNVPRQMTPKMIRAVPPGEPLDDCPLPNCPIQDIALTELVSQLLTELRLASAMALMVHGLSIRYGLGRKSRRAMSGHQSWAVLRRCRCRLLLAEIQKVVDRNSELKQRLQLCETAQISDLICKVLGQQDSGPLRRRARRVQTQADEQRGKRACALTA